MSPEQASGKAVDSRTDVYAAGIVLFELLSDSRLYEADADLVVLEKVRESAIPFDRVMHAPAEIREVCRKALARETVDRYENAAQFLGELSACSVRCGYSVCASEFGTYLKGLFPDRAEEGCEGEGRATRIMPEGGMSLSSLRRGAAALLIVLISAMLPAGVGRKADAEQIVEEKPKTAFGRISVNASPWGLVTVPGYAARRETPVRSLKVEAGNYRVRVIHPPSGRRVGKDVTVPADGRVRCFAKLLPAASIVCR
jgi:hypothetical protein